jgi:hypothetical protein
MNEFREGYARAILDINGLRTDAEDPLDYIEGYNFAMRYDAQVKCKPGNKPCGKTCIPMKETCRVSGGGGKAAKIAGGVAAAGALGAAGTYALNKGFRNKVNNTAKSVAKNVGRQAKVAVANTTTSKEDRNKARKERQQNIKTRKKKEKQSKLTQTRAEVYREIGSEAAVPNRYKNKPGYRPKNNE